MTTYKTANKKYGTLPAKLEEEIQWNKIGVYLIGPYKIHRKRKDTLILKHVTMIDPVTRWSEVA